MKYCNNCLIPEIRPDQFLINGTCNACLSFENKKNINWKDKKKKIITNN